MAERRNDLRFVGTDLRGVDSQAKLTGAAVYTSDLHRPGMLHAKVLRSPHPHARIVSVDVARARGMAGVAAVITGRDLDGLDYHYGMYIRDQPVLARDRVRYVGEPVAAVAATSEEEALAALSAIEIVYDLLPSIATIGAALVPDAYPLFDATLHDADLQPPPPNSAWVQEPSPNVLFQFDYAKWDVEDWLSRADHVFEHHFQFSRLSHFALEPHVAIADVSADGAVDVWANNQDPFLLRQDIARIFRMPLARVRFHTGLVGGGFGSKSYCKTEPIAVLLAFAARRPVRLALTMAESMLTVCEHAAELVFRTGVSAAGETLVRDATVRLDGGAYADASPSVAMRLGARFNGPYRWRALRSQVKVVRTNSVPAGSFRGFGAVHVAWASESQIDMIAKALGRDPLAMRRANFLRPGEPGAPDESPLDSDLAAGLHAVATRIGYESRVATPGRGIGFACAIKGAGGSHQAEARVRIEPSGRVFVAAGVTEIGQSTRTILTQIVAEELQIDPAGISVEDIDTSNTPFDSGTHASTGATVSGLAVQEAARAARDALLERVCDALAVERRTILWNGSDALVGTRRYSFAECAALAGSHAAIEGRGSVKTAGGAFFWMPVWTAADVEVDAETGTYRVHRIVNAVDAGRAINPQRCVSQVEGGAVQGFGQTIFEHLAYDAAHPLNANPLRYQVPRLGHLPDSFETIVLEQGQGPGPYGAKGLGETGNLTIAAAIANAIAAAVDIRVTDLPITPAKIVESAWVASAEP